MANHDSIVSSDKLTAIADAIRAKTHKLSTMTLDQMPDEIASISGGGGGGVTPKHGVVHSSWSSLGYVLTADLYGNRVLPATFQSTDGESYTMIDSHKYYPDGAPDSGGGDSGSDCGSDSGGDSGGDSGDSGDSGDDSSYNGDFYGQYSYITDVTFHDNIIVFGKFAFSSAYWFALNELPSTVETIGRYAFYNCYSVHITEIPASVKDIGEQAFAGLEQNWKLIPEYSAESTYSVDDITYYSGAYYICIEDVDTPEPFDSSKFSYMDESEVKLLYPPQTALTFLGKPDNIAYDAFYECNFSEIRVPWAKGEVLYAPWGFDGKIVYLWGKYIADYIVDIKYATIGVTSDIDVTFVESEDPSVDYGTEYVITVYGNATLSGDADTGYKLTPNDDASDGDEVILTISSVKDPSYSFNKVVTIVVPSISFNSAGSGWTDTGTTQQGYPVYDCLTTLTDDNICEITVKGYRHVRFVFRRVVTSGYVYPYLYYGKLDGYVSQSQYVTSSYVTNTSWSNMYGYTYDIAAKNSEYPESPFYPEETHTIKVLLPKSTSTGTLPHVQFYMIPAL